MLFVGYSYTLFMVPCHVLMRNDKPNTSSQKAPETVLILDFGSQYAQLIARRVREAGAFSLLMAPDTPIEKLMNYNLVGIILSGGPNSVGDDSAPRCDVRLFEIGVPVLGICYGMQLGCFMLGGKIEGAESREFGRSTLHVQDQNGLFRDGISRR